jgi:hypothetical protein
LPNKTKFFLAAKKDLARCYKKQEYSNNYNKTSSECVFLKCHSFATCIRRLEQALKEYADMILSIIDLSRKKENRTMGAISQSFVAFMDATTKYFGPKISGFYGDALKSMQTIAANDDHFMTYKLQNLFSSEEIIFMGARLDSTPASLDDLSRFCNNFSLKINLISL